LSTIEKCHEGNSRLLTIDPLYRYLVSGSSDGTIKVWDINKSLDDNDDTIPLLYTFDGHNKITIIKPLSTGVTTYAVTGLFGNTKGIYSCGADGRLVFRSLVCK